MALTEKLTAIADAIRAQTGGSEQLTLTQMAEEITEKLSGNCKCVVVTIAKNKTSRFTAISGDSELATHYNEPTLWAAYIALGVAQIPSGTSYRLYSIASNSPIAVRNTSEMVYAYGGRSDGTTLNATIGNSAMSGDASNIGVTSAGDLTIYANAAAPIPAGNFLIAFGWEM